MRATQNVTAFENNEKPSIDLLDRHLASAIDLQLRLRSALWNMEDPRLAETRELGTKASEIEQFCNLIAERLRALSAVAHATPHGCKYALSSIFIRPLPPVTRITSPPLSAPSPSCGIPRGRPGKEPPRFAMRRRPPCSPGSRAPSTDRFGFSARHRANAGNEDDRKP